MIISILTYVKPIQEVEKYLQQHNSYLDNYYNEKKFIASGRRNPRTGGVILMDATLEEAQEIAKHDPFLIHEVAEYSFIEFLPSKCAPEFANLLK
ncbi:MAG: cyclohydrolase [Neobacillus sp.]|nr:cyclohydrolase [Neobacillus sp.]